MPGYYIDSKSVILERGPFVRRKSLVLELSTWDWERNGLNEGLLNEGRAWDLTKEALSWAVKALASYGSGAAGAVLTLPAGGEGLALAPVVDTALDAWGAIDTVKGAVGTVKGISEKVGTFSEIVNQVIDAFKYVKTDTEKFYKVTCKVVGKGLSLLGKGAQKKVKEFARKLKTIAEETAMSISDAVISSLKFLIPETSVGSAVAMGIKSIVAVAMVRPYTTLGTVISGAGKLANFIVDPEWAPRFVSSLVAKLIKFADGMADKFEKAQEKEKEEEGSLMKAAKVGAMVLNPIGYFMWSKASEKFRDPKIWRSIAEKLDGLKPTIISVTEAITKFVVPAWFALVAVYQAVSTGDFLEHAPANANANDAKGIKDNTVPTKDSTVPTDDKKISAKDKKVSNKNNRLSKDLGSGDDEPEIGVSESFQRRRGAKSPSLRVLL